MEVFLKTKAKKKYLVMESPLSDDKGFEEWEDAQILHGCGIAQNLM